MFSKQILPFFSHIAFSSDIKMYVEKQNTSFLESKNIYLFNSCETFLPKKISASKYYTIGVTQ